MFDKLAQVLMRWIEVWQSTRNRQLDLQSRQLDIQEKAQNENLTLQRNEQTYRMAQLASNSVRGGGVNKILNDALNVEQTATAPTSPLKPVPNSAPVDEDSVTKPDPTITDLDRAKARAKELGIKLKPRMREATILKLIEEKETELDESAGFDSETERYMEDDGSCVDPELKNYSQEETRQYIQKYVDILKVKNKDGNETSEDTMAETYAFMEEVTGFSKLATEIFKQPNSQELCNKLVAACIEKGAKVE